MLLSGETNLAEKTASRTRRLALSATLWRSNSADACASLTLRSETTDSWCFEMRSLRACRMFSVVALISARWSAARALKVSI